MKRFILVLIAILLFTGATEARCQGRSHIKRHYRNTYTSILDPGYHTGTIRKQLYSDTVRCVTPGRHGRDHNCGGDQNGYVARVVSAHIADIISGMPAVYVTSWNPIPSSIRRPTPFTSKKWDDNAFSGEPIPWSIQRLTQRCLIRGHHRSNRFCNGNHDGYADKQFSEGVSGFTGAKPSTSIHSNARNLDVPGVEVPPDNSGIAGYNPMVSDMYMHLCNCIYDHAINDIRRAQGNSTTFSCNCKCHTPATITDRQRQVSETCASSTVNPRLRSDNRSHRPSDLFKGVILACLAFAAVLLIPRLAAARPCVPLLMI